MNILNKKLFFSSKSLSIIIKILTQNKGTARLIGGCVRNALLGLKNSTDIDIATDLLPDEVLNLLKKAGIRALPTGKAFGTITAITKDETFEITTLRRDTNHDGRHAIVEFSQSYEEDSERRDFTINALSYDLDKNNIYDYHGGIHDLLARKVKFIGNPKQRIEEDYLRILRFFRFSGLYALDIDEDGLRAIQECKAGLKQLSKERIKSEFDKIISQDNCFEVIKLMIDLDILDLIFPVDQNCNIKVLENILRLANKLGIILAKEFKYSILLSRELKLQELLNFKFSKVEAAKIIDISLNLSLQNIDEFYLRKIWFRHQDYKSYIICLIAANMIEESAGISFLQEKENNSRPAFPINGHDLLSKGIEGENIKIQLNKLTDIWIKNDFNLNKGDLLKMVNINV